MAVVALAGRRVDALDAEEPRFPLRAVEAVGDSLVRVFGERGASTLVCSAACGADLVALSRAGVLGLRRRIVLPYARERFRETSVVDRPGDWGTLFDLIVEQVAASGDLVVLDAGPGPDAYLAANTKILDEAETFAKLGGEPALAVLVSDGALRGERDVTEQFGDEAQRRGLEVVAVKTL